MSTALVQLSKGKKALVSFGAIMLTVAVACYGLAPAHNPKVMFNEDVCPIGASSYAHCATEWLKNNK